MTLKTLRELVLVLLGGTLLYHSFLQAKSDSKYVEWMGKMSYQQAIEHVQTPKQAERYLRLFLSPEQDINTFKEQDYIASFRRIHENRKDDCDGGALAAAALLSDDGYPPLLLAMYKKEHSLENLGGHGVFVYQQNGKWGTLGINVVDHNPPIYSSIEEIVKAYGYEKFNVMNISEQYPDWLTNNINMNRKLYRPDLAKMLK